MILRNYDNAMLRRMCPDLGSNFSSDNSEFGDGHVNFKNLTGDIFTYSGAYWYFDPLSRFEEKGNTEYSANGRSNLICGSGSTPEHYDDYKLESAFSTSQITNVSGVHKIETPIYDENTKTWTFTYTRNFLANEDIVVREIGVITSINYQNNDSYRHPVLMYRKVLETPLEVTAGNQFSLSFTVTLSANPNKPADYDASAVVVE